MRFEFIEAENACFPVKSSWRVLGVSRSGHYAWKTRPESARPKADLRLSVQVRAIHKESRGVYGSPRVHAELVARGERCGRHRVARLMREQGLFGKQRRRGWCTTRTGGGSMRATTTRTPLLITRWW